MADPTRFDELLMSLASQSGGIEPLLSAVFSFLYRRTDFYVIKPAGDPSARMGFDEGQAQAILLRCFDAFPFKALNATPSSPPSLPRAAPTPAPAPATLDPTALQTQLHLTTEGRQVPRNNGGATERYVWTQTLHEATVHLPLAEGLRARDLDVALRATGLVVQQKGSEEVEFEGEWPRRVAVGESVWTVDGSVLVVSVDKAERGWWSCAFQGGAQIDTSLVDSKTKVDDYDGETQGVIRKIMFDQQQRSRGLPTSEEMQQQELWDKAKFAPGSPFLPGGAFAGQENDVTMERGADGGFPKEAMAAMPDAQAGAREEGTEKTAA